MRCGGVKRVSTPPPRRYLVRRANLSGRATTKPPSAVIITPALTPLTASSSSSSSSPAFGAGRFTSMRKLFGIPVVRLIRGRLSYAGSLLVGHSWIQWPTGRNSLIVNVTAHSTGRELESLTFLTATVADVARRWRLVRHSGVAERGPSGGVVVVTGRGSVRSVRIAVDRRGAGKDSSGLVQMQPQNAGELTWPSALVFVATACWSRQTWLPSPTLRRWEQRQEFEQTA